MRMNDLAGIGMQLRIDRVLLHPAEVEVLGRRDPYPGGRRRFRHLDGPHADSVLKGAELGAGRDLDATEVRRVLNRLTFALPMLYGAEQARAAVSLRWSFNSIDRVEVETGNLQMAGVGTRVPAQAPGEE